MTFIIVAMGISFIVFTLWIFCRDLMICVLELIRCFILMMFGYIQMKIAEIQYRIALRRYHKRVKNHRSYDPSTTTKVFSDPDILVALMKRNWSGVPEHPISEEDSDG